MQVPPTEHEDSMQEPGIPSAIEVVTDAENDDEPKLDFQLEQEQGCLDMEQWLEA